jgi:hypothetical protein
MFANGHILRTSHGYHATSDWTCRSDLPGDLPRSSDLKAKPNVLLAIKGQFAGRCPVFQRFLGRCRRQDNEPDFRGRRR